MRFRSRLPKLLLVVSLFLALLVATIAAAGVRLCRQPLDISSTALVPSWVERAVKRDEVAYPFHATLGTALNQFSCQPLATGLQWFKAAAHARSAADLDQAAEGLSSARERGESGEALASDLCRNLARGREGGQQMAALAKAGIQCAGPTPAAR